MIYIFEGMDKCLKDTFIQKLRGSLAPETQVLKFSTPPDVHNKEAYQKKHFKDMFNILTTSVTTSSRNVILNRAHLGECVYAPIYRGYSADWIFDLEEEFLSVSSSHNSITKLILLYDSSNNQLRKREDGKSLSKMNDEKLNNERKLFIEAFHKSRFRNKIEFDLSLFVLSDEKDPSKEIDTKEILRRILTI